TFVSGNNAWDLNAQGQPQPANDQAEARQFLIWVSPHGFIKAAMADPNVRMTQREFTTDGRTLKVIGFTTMGKYKATGELNAVKNAGAARVNIQTTKLAEGVWLIAGGSHNSIAVEFKDFAAIIETPLDDARSNAVIAETKRLIPNKQIKYVVNTHHHWDHAG